MQSEVRNLEAERERLRKELHKVKEVLHEQHNLHSPIYQNIEYNTTDNLTSTPTTTDCTSEQSSTPLNDSIQVGILNIFIYKTPKSSTWHNVAPTNYINTRAHVIETRMSEIGL